MDMEVSPMDSLGISDENHAKCRVKSDNFYIGNTNSLCQSSPNCMTFGMIFMRKT